MTRANLRSQSGYPGARALAATESVTEDMARMIRREIPGVKGTLSVPSFNALEKVN